MRATGAGEDMGAYEKGTAATPDDGSTLLAEVRRVLALVDAHAARAARDGVPGDGSADGSPTAAAA